MAGRRIRGRWIYLSEEAENNTEITDFTKGILTLMDVDFSGYRRKMDQKLV